MIASAVLLALYAAFMVYVLIVRRRARRPKSTMVLRIGVITDKTTSAELAEQINKAIREQR